MILPRQARDKHRENSKKETVFRTEEFGGYPQLKLIRVVWTRHRLLHSQDLPDILADEVPLRRKRVRSRFELFCELSLKLFLCLSRACLGQLILHTLDSVKCGGKEERFLTSCIRSVHQTPKPFSSPV